LREERRPWPLPSFISPKSTLLTFVPRPVMELAEVQEVFMDMTVESNPEYIDRDLVKSNIKPLKARLNEIAAKLHNVSQPSTLQY
jgi:hypothetical protein